MKEKIEWIYKIIILITCGIGIYLNFDLFSVATAMVYYTIQSNIMCFLFYAVIIILHFCGKLEKSNYYHILHGTVVMAITLTMVVFQTVIINNETAFDGHEIVSVFVHLIVPLLIIFDYLIFEKKGTLKKSYPFIWSLSLVIYTVMLVIYMKTGGTFVGGAKYPYMYMNIEKYGVLKVAVANIGIYVVFIVYGMIVQQLDSVVGHHYNK